MEENPDLPEFVLREIGKRSSTVKLTNAEDVRAHCLSGPKARIAVILRGKSFHYTITKAKRIAGGWKIEAKIPLERKIVLHDGQRKRPTALVGHIGADFRFKRRGKSLPIDDPIIQAFLELYELVFVRNVMRPAEMSIEAHISVPHLLE